MLMKNMRRRRAKYLIAMNVMYNTVSRILCTGITQIMCCCVMKHNSCPIKFTDKKSIERFIGNKIKNYKCSFCEMRYNVKHLLLRHMKFKHEDIANKNGCDFDMSLVYCINATIA